MNAFFNSNNRDKKSEGEEKEVNTGINNIIKIKIEREEMDVLNKRNSFSQLCKLSSKIKVFAGWFLLLPLSSGCRQLPPCPTFIWPFLCVCTPGISYSQKNTSSRIRDLPLDFI